MEDFEGSIQNVFAAFPEGQFSDSLLADVQQGRTRLHVSLEVLKFWTHTDTTALYWDVVAIIDVRISVGSESGGEGIQRATFSCEQTKRTYTWPSLDLVTDVMDACLVELVTGMRGDAVWLKR